ncbi:MAG TPA: hypothetical protein PLE28_01310 [bacterium]|nr:hypothetical protein [bacterium]
MDEKISQFLQKINALPEEVSLYFSSDLSIKSTEELLADYNIDQEAIDDIIRDFFVSDFSIDELEKSIALKIDNKNNINNFINDFLGKLFLPVASFVNAKIEDAIKKHQGNIEEYKNYVNDFFDLIEDKNFDELGDFVKDLEEKIDFKEEEALVLNFLGTNLVEVLKNNDSSGAIKINGSALYLLANREDCLEKFIKAFLSNSEKISSKNILIDNREQEPTIANWIKHFVKENSSEIFSNIVLAKYLISPTVVALLNDDEKKLLRKVLKLYRNLVFFPESMANIPINDWEIIPIDRDADFLKNKEDVKQKIDKFNNQKEEKELKVEDKKDIEPIKKIIDQPAKTPELPKTEDIKLMDLKNKELQELEELLLKYPEKSLERKVINTEIKKINKKK